MRVHVDLASTHTWANTQQQNLTYALTFHFPWKGQVACIRGLRLKFCRGTDEWSQRMSNTMTYKSGIFLKILILYHIITLNVIKCQLRQFNNLKLSLIWYALCDLMTKQIIVLPTEISVCIYNPTHTKHTNLNQYYAKCTHKKPISCTLTHKDTHTCAHGCHNQSDLVYWSPAVSCRRPLESMASHKRQHYSLSAGAKHKVTFTLLPHFPACYN